MLITVWPHRGGLPQSRGQDDPAGQVTTVRKREQKAPLKPTNNNLKDTDKHDGYQRRGGWGSTARVKGQIHCAERRSDFGSRAPGACRC